MDKERLLQLIERVLSTHDEADKELAKILEEKYRSPYYKLMYHLSKEMNSSTCVELGVHRAIGSTMMALGNPSCQVYGFDHDPHPQAFEMQNKISNFELYKQSSCPPPDNIRDIDIMLLDTTVGMKKEEFKLWSPLMKPGGIVLMDDLCSQDGILIPWFRELLGTPIQDDRLHPVVGFGILLLNS